MVGNIIISVIGYGSAAFLFIAAICGVVIGGREGCPPLKAVACLILSVLLSGIGLAFGAATKWATGI